MEFGKGFTFAINQLHFDKLGYDILFCKSDFHRILVF